MAIGTLRCFAIGVEDLETGASFWSELTGIPRISSPWPDRFAYLGYEDETAWRHEIILHRVTTAKRSDPDAVDVARRIDPGANRAHIDIGVDDVDLAIAQVEKIGGRLTVMQDPFGNEFCLVRELTRAERKALDAAAEHGPADDAHWRAVASSARATRR